MLVFTNIKRIKLNNIKIWMYYAVHNNTKYYLITSYLLRKPTNNGTLSENTTILDEVYKSTKSIRN